MHYAAPTGVTTIKQTKQKVMSTINQAPTGMIPTRQIKLEATITTTIEAEATLKPITDPAVIAANMDTATTAAYTPADKEDVWQSTTHARSAT